MFGSDAKLHDFQVPGTARARQGAEYEVQAAAGGGGAGYR